MYRFFVFLLSLLFLFSCKSEPDFAPAEDAMDAGRQFIDGTLKGEFRKARFYLLSDAANNAQLSKIEAAYDKQNADYRVQYRQASIIIEKEETVNDSTHVIHYENSFDKKPQTVTIVRHNGQWLVDLEANVRKER